jgi:hypothetical protein
VQPFSLAIVQSYMSLFACILLGAAASFTACILPLQRLRRRKCSVLAVHYAHTYTKLMDALPAIYMHTYISSNRMRIPQAASHVQPCLALAQHGSSLLQASPSLL